MAVGAAEHGASVVCLDIDETAAQRVAARIGRSASSGQLDIRNGRGVSSALERVVADSGRLDVVVCTPSINIRKPILELTSDEVDCILDLNLKGAFNVVRAAGRLMSEAGQPDASSCLCPYVRRSSNRASLSDAMTKPAPSNWCERLPPSSDPRVFA